MEAARICLKCGSEKISYTNEVNTRSRGCLFQALSLLLAICTLGLSLIITSSMRKVTTKNKVVAICQRCGAKWKV